MKQRSLLMLLPFALVVTGCGSSLEKGSIFTEKFMKRNFGAETITKHEYAAPEKVDFTFEDGVEAQVQTDLIKLTKDEIQGYYNVMTNTYAVPLSEGLKSVNTASSNGARIFYGTKKVNEKDISVVFDDYGNRLYEGPKINPSVYCSTISLDDVVENERYKVEIRDGTTDVAIAYYNVDGSFKEVITMDEFYERNPLFGYGDSLKTYGHPDHYLFTSMDNGDEIRVQVFNAKKGKFTSSFVVPEAANGQIYTIGDNVIYQITELLPQRAEKYDYSDGEDKFFVNTYSVNYLNGSVKTIKTDIVFGAGVLTKTLYNEKNLKKLMAFEGIRKIDKDKVLSPITREVILNENLKEIADVTSVQFRDLKRFANTEYYVNPNGVIFDYKLQEVGVKRGEQAGDRYKTHVVKESNGYGLVNHQGEYIVKPIYPNCETLVDDTFFCLNSTGSWKLVSVNENEEATVTRDVLKEVFTEGGAAPVTAFGKYKTFTRKNDSKVFLFDITTGNEIEMPEKPEGSATKVNNQLVTRTFSTFKARFSLYEKDGTYTVIRLTDKSVSEYSSIK